MLDVTQPLSAVAVLAGCPRCPTIVTTPRFPIVRALRAHTVRCAGLTPAVVVPDFSEFWNYDDIGCRYMVPQELLIPGTGELFVVTAVEEKQILRHSCTATTCQTAVNTTNYFTLDPDNSVYVSCHHSYKTSWGDIGFDIAADLVDIHGNVIGSVSSGDPIRFLLRDILKAAGVSSLNNRATFGGNSTR